MSLEIQPIDTVTAPESVLRELHEYYVGYDAEHHPEDPPMPWEQRLSLWRHLLEHVDMRRWVLRDDGEIVGVAVAAMQDDDPDNAFVRVHVKPERRRQGLAKVLAEPILAVLDEGDRGKVITDTSPDAPWDPALERLGMKKVFQSRESRLLIEDVDWDLMDSWIERAAERANDYEIRHITFPISDQDIQNWCDVMMIMNTAPTEDLDIEDFNMTPKKWRDIEAKDLARGRLLSGYVAIHRPTGQWVGLSEILFNENHPEQAEQGDTAVHPDHRNHGLGRWLKAAMIRQFVVDHPEAERINTDNADSNEPMLNINTEMGYKPLRIEIAWQGKTSDIRQGLGL
jgi:GNAT superfamily N-acetyltransferase